MIKTIRVKVNPTPELNKRLIFILKVAYIIYNWGIEKAHRFTRAKLSDKNATVLKLEFEKLRKNKLLTNHEGRIYTRKELAIINSVPDQMKFNQFSKIIGSYNRNHLRTKRPVKSAKISNIRSMFTLRAANAEVFRIYNGSLKVAGLEINLPDDVMNVIQSTLNIEYVDFKLLNNEWYLVFRLFNKKYKNEESQKVKKYRF